MADIYLYSVPSDANSSDIRLRDPTSIAGGGTQTLTATRVTNASTFGAHSLTHRLIQARVIDADSMIAGALRHVIRPSKVNNVLTFGAPTLATATTLVTTTVVNANAFGVPVVSAVAPPVVVPITGGRMAAQYAEIDEDDEEVIAIASAFLRIAA